MAWYKGTVTEAIMESRRSSKLFLVYVAGNDEDSRKMNDVWLKENVQSICQNNCVCLKIASDSVDCQQFAQIYPVLTIPITYCIGTNGNPIEILAGFNDESVVMEKLQAAVQVQQSNNLPQANQPFESTPQSSTSRDSSEPTPAGQETQAPPATSSQSTPSSTEMPAETAPADIPVPGYSDDDDVRVDEALAADATNTPSSSTSEKVQQLQEKLQQHRAEKAAQSQMEEKKKEIARRITGKQIQEMKEKQTDMKIKMELAERKKEAAAKKEALERVRAEIARDRAEKQKKFDGEAQVRRAEEEKKLKEKEETTQKELEAQARLREKISRIQFRFPDGSALTRQYDSSSLLDVCFEDLPREAGDKLPRNFELFTTVPSHVFNDADKRKSLLELNLVPSVAIYIRPKRAIVSSAPGPFSGGVFSFVMIVFMFPFNVMKKVWDFFTGSNAATGDAPQSRPSPSTTKYSDNTKPGSNLRRRNIPGSSSGDRETVREGRMHRLHDVKKDDDDDTATWNGNSTQQM